MLCCDWCVLILYVSALFPRRSVVVRLSSCCFFFIVSNFYCTVPIAEVLCELSLWPCQYTSQENHNWQHQPHSKAVCVQCFGHALKWQRSGYRLVGCLSRAPLFCLALVFQSHRYKPRCIHRESCKLHCLGTVEHGAFKEDLKPVYPIAWWRLTVCSRNVPIHIISDYIVRQTILLYYCILPWWVSTTFFTKLK